MYTLAAIAAFSVMGLALSNPLAARQVGFASTKAVLFPSGDCQGTPLNTILIGGTEKCLAFDQQAASVQVQTSVQQGAAAGKYTFVYNLWSDKVCTTEVTEGRMLDTNQGACINTVGNAIEVQVAFEAT